ncbi:MAG: DUF3048 domain-containing protein [Tessaracoccus sp.]|uniref:DUF3048 domain-containing protein n=1 Tax=Tessaracoccus sp. TaxID=1971211 RepID=UPI001ED14A70|nr:DUF3048 domain-containing protein [Tessaracoccus sp.]MBK7822686.1 DUF3048 domain-containing protein [Tessaracoccus sp.]
METSRRVVLSAGMAAAGATLAACGGKPEPVVTPTLTPTPSPSPTLTPSPSPSPSPTPEPIEPLTGRPLTDASLLKRPAVALKVPNLKVEQPQVGLQEADIVFCQVNGFAYTRLCPVYHSSYPKAVGPIRSIRPVDIPLLSPMKPVFGNTGAADWVLAYADKHSGYLERMTYLDWRGTGAFSVNKDRLYRANGRTEYDRAIQAHPAKMAELATRNTKAPKPYFPFAPRGTEASTSVGEKAKTIEVPYGSAHKYDMSYEYDKGSSTYLRSQPWGEHILAGGTRVSADAVLIIAAAWEMGRIGYGKHAPDPIVDIIDAKGTFHYAHGGKVVKGTWKKGAVNKRFSFTLADGSPLLMAPGRTWVEMPAPSADLRIT